MKSKIIVLITIFITCFCIVSANDNLSINSKAAISMDADSSTVLYNKNIDQKVYPASTTKILTAILTIENIDLNRNVVVTKSAIAIPWDSSSVYLKEGEIISVKDLLYCLLLNSGNDAANVLAEAVSGDIDSFVKLMNQKLQELGCTQTNFTNAHGYSDDNHYTTALDMAKILNYCIENPTFVEIMSTKSYIVNETNKTKEKRYLYNTNRLILTKEDSVYARYYEYCIGGKTGYTDEAGRTLVTFGKKDGKTVIVAIFGASSSGSKDVRYTDAINLFEYSFNNFTKKTIAKADEYNFNYINTNKRLNYTLGLKQDFEMLCHNSKMPDFYYTININEDNLKNIDDTNFREVAAGTITFYYSDINGHERSIDQTLYLKEVSRYFETKNSYIKIILVFTVTLAVILLFIIILANSKNKISKTKSRKNRRK